MLANGTRGFERTSMSACIFIQPEPLLNELKSLRGNDGLIDRFLFISAKPVFHINVKLSKNISSLFKNQKCKTLFSLWTKFIQNINSKPNTSLPKKLNQVMKKW